MMRATFFWPSVPSGSSAPQPAVKDYACPFGPLAADGDGDGGTKGDSHQIWGRPKRTGCVGQSRRKVANERVVQGCAHTTTTLVAPDSLGRWTLSISNGGTTWGAEWIEGSWRRGDGGLPGGQKGQA
jgi:hypothetical protein